jgi:iron-sulfur cluster repair protein YtfE (RIC family)
MTALHDETEAVRAFTEHEHTDLAWGIERMHDAGRRVGQLPGAGTVLQVRDVLNWFDRQLEPHLAWEESWLYPEVDHIAGTPWATRSMRLDHAQLRAAMQRLRDDEIDAIHDHTPAVDERIRWRLFTLEALVRAHVEREDRLLLPVLGEGRGTRG